MIQHNIYRHIGTLDTDMYVHKVTYYGPKYIRVKATIFGRKNHCTFERGSYTIKREDVWKWRCVPYDKT